MTQIHNHEIEQFKTLFRQEGIDRIEERLTILETFLQTESHITLEELTGLLRARGIHPDHEFIRDTVTLLCEFGFANKVRFENGPVRYEHRHLGQHHDHMVCTKCRNIIEFADEELELLQKQIAAAHGFHMLQHKMEIYGICEGCRTQEIELMPLSAARQGETLTIKEFAGGQSRLSSMGLRVGDRVEVITSQGRGQFVIAVEGKRYVLGRGVSKKIMVEPANGESPASAPRPARAPEAGEGPAVPLSHLKEGQSARITRVGGAGALRRRILEMGMTRGTDIYVEKYAPLKDPVELIVKGYHVSLRVEEAAQITVDNVKQDRS